MSNINNVISGYRNSTKVGDVDINEAITYGYREGIMEGKATIVDTIKRIGVLILVAIAIIFGIWGVSACFSEPSLTGNTVTELIECYERQHNVHIWPYRRNLIRNVCKDVDQAEWPDIVKKLCKDGSY